MLILALSTGLRFGELVGLCINDLDFKNNLISVRRQWKYKEGGGFSDLKTEKSERTISIDKLTMTALKKHLISVKNDPANVYDLVFFEPSSDISVVTNDSLNDTLQSILNRLKIKPLITVHGLRHTHASILLY